MAGAGRLKWVVAGFVWLGRAQATFLWDASSCRALSAVCIGRQWSDWAQGFWAGEGKLAMLATIVADPESDTCSSVRSSLFTVLSLTTKSSLIQKMIVEWGTITPNSGFLHNGYVQYARITLGGKCCLCYQICFIPEDVQRNDTVPFACDIFFRKLSRTWQARCKI